MSGEADGGRDVTTRRVVELVRIMEIEHEVRNTLRLNGHLLYFVGSHSSPRPSIPSVCRAVHAHMCMQVARSTDAHSRSFLLFHMTSTSL